MCTKSPLAVSGTCTLRRSTIVSYWKRDTRDKADGKAATLLDMAAGASDESEEDAMPDDGENGNSDSLRRLCLDDDGIPVVNDNILQSMQEEVSRHRQYPDHCTQGTRAEEMSFLSLSVFHRTENLRTHLNKYHTAAQQYVCSGTKQIKLVLAPSGNVNSIDKQIRLVLDASGPFYANLECLGQILHARRVRNLYYTHSFANLILREMVMGHAQAARLI